MAPVDHRKMDRAVDAGFDEAREGGAEEFGELSAAHLAVRHCEIAMLDLPLAAEALRREIPRRVREHHVGESAAHEGRHDRVVERVAADQAMRAKLIEVSGLTPRRNARG